ncbi:MAG: serine hydrolase domain-containing protein [Pseudomonadota bacterium]
MKILHNIGVDLPLAASIAQLLTVFALPGTPLAIGAEAGESLNSETSKSVLVQLDALVNDARLDIRAPGAVYGVVANGETVHLKAFGQRRIETDEAVSTTSAFRIASMTKMMTSLLIGDLYDQGEISLDAPAETYVPELKDWTYPTTDSRKVTVRDFLNHTAGFVWDDPWADRQMARTPAELDEFLERAEPFTRAPGTRWEYSNLGFVLLGRIVENVSGQTFVERLRERILDPLEMNDSGLAVSQIADRDRAFGYQWINGEFIPEPVLASGTFDPLGGLWTTAEDYAKFVAWFLSAWPARDDPDPGPIPRRVVRSVTDAAYIRGIGSRPGFNGSEDCLIASGYSMGLSLVHHCKAGLMLRHSGGFPGYGTHVIMMPELGIGVFGFANRTYAEMYGPIFDAAAILATSGMGTPLSSLPPDQRLLDTYRAVGDAFAVGNMQNDKLRVEDNFFLDRSVERWNAKLAAMHTETGTCDTSAPLKHDGRLSGAFTWECETARVTGYMTVSPIAPDELQMLHIRPMRRDESGRDMKIDHDWH